MARRVVKVSDEATAGLVVNEQAAKLSGDRDNFIHLCSDGVSIVGNISLLAEPENIRIGSVWVLPRGYEAMLPSTAVNPQPILVLNNPAEGITSLVEEVAQLLAELV